MMDVNELRGLEKALENYESSTAGVLRRIREHLAWTRKRLADQEVDA